MYLQTLAATRTVNGLFPGWLLALPLLVVVAVLAAVWGSVWWLGRLRSQTTLSQIARGSPITIQPKTGGVSKHADA